MEKSSKKRELRFAHIFIVAAFLIVLINFAISGFAPYFMVLIPASPFLVLAVFPISWKPVAHSEKHGIIGAGIGALISTLPAIILFSYNMATGWRGGADIGLGLLYMFMPLYSILFIALGYLFGEITVLIRQRKYQRLPSVFKALSLFMGAGFCLYFVYKAHQTYNLWIYHKIYDPSAAELYEIDFWLFILMAGASWLIPLAVYFITGRDRRATANRTDKDIQNKPNGLP